MYRYDIIVIGGGPAGLSSALYTSRSNLKTLVIEKKGIGALEETHLIENYPGVEKIKGSELRELMKKQTEKFGAEFIYSTFLELIKEEDESFTIKTDTGRYSSNAVIIASGSNKRNTKKLIGEEEYFGRGVSYCATCDGAFYRNKNVVVAGNGEEAAEEALFLTKYAKSITVINSEEIFTADKELLELIEKSDKITVKNNTKISAIRGEDFVEKIEILQDGVVTEVEATGIFIYLGTKNTGELFSMYADIDENGYIVTDEEMKTLTSGCFAAGDIRKKTLRQVSTAVSDGAIAGVEAIKYLLKKKKSE